MIMLGTNLVDKCLFYKFKVQKYLKYFIIFLQLTKQKGNLLSINYFVP